MQEQSSMNQSVLPSPVTVVGAGISGLIAAWECTKQGRQVQVFEATGSAGGMLGSFMTPFGLVEKAAHSILVTPRVAQWFADLGISLEPPRSVTRYILRERTFKKFPLKVHEIAILLMRMIFCLRRDRLQDQTVERFGQRHFGKAVVENLLAPMLLGIYGAKPDEVLMSLAFPQLDMSPGHSVLSSWLVRLVSSPFRTRPGRGKMMAPQHGFQEVVDALLAKVSSEVHLESPVEQIDVMQEHILAVDAHRAAEILLKSGIDPIACEALGHVEYCPLVSVTVFIPTASIQGGKFKNRGPTSTNKESKLPAGIGCLTRPKDSRFILGILFNSGSFSGRVVSSKYTSLTFMLGGSLMPQWVKKSDQQIRDQIAFELSDLFGIATLEMHMFINRWPKAVPLFDWKLDRARRLMSQALQGTKVVLFSNYTSAIGIRGLIEQSQRLFKTTF
jgi:oxygen-dependent protoporphyrinogen oxidase